MVFGPEEDVATGLDPAEVCTLSPDALAGRIAWIRHEILPHARRTERLESGLAWELDRAPGLAEKVDHLIALERECCSGIVFERLESATWGRMRLEIRGIDPDAEVFQSLRRQGARTPDVPRLAKAAAAGALGSVFVCCVLPVAAVALLGSLAAPLASLDSPGPLVAGALVGGGGVWWWLGRRRAGSAAEARPAARCGRGC